MVFPILPDITGVGNFIPHVHTTRFLFHIVHVPLVDIATRLNRSTSGMGIFISTRGAGASSAQVDGYEMWWVYVGPSLQVG